MKILCKIAEKALCAALWVGVVVGVCFLVVGVLGLAVGIQLLQALAWVEERTRGN